MTGVEGEGDDRGSKFDLKEPRPAAQLPLPG